MSIKGHNGQRAISPGPRQCPADIIYMCIEREREAKGYSNARCVLWKELEQQPTDGTKVVPCHCCAIGYVCARVHLRGE